MQGSATDAILDSMKKRFLAISLLICSSVLLQATTPKKLNLLMAPGTLSETSVALLWDKQFAKEAVSYQILVNGKEAGSSKKTNFLLSNLQPSTWYTVTIKVNGTRLKANSIRFKTAEKGTVYNILDFGAKDDSSFLNTKAIQSAIDACSPGGTVLIPKGVFKSGALWLKSNMTLRIEKGAVLKGSVNPADYLPKYLNRFEGWEMETYASLINAGKLDRSETYSVKNLRITGGGTISGGGRTLSNAIIKTDGLRGRGRLICLMNCQDVSIDNLAIKEPPCWTIHYIYSDNITLHNLDIHSDVRNGDGVDPDSSTDSYIFNCSFDTGDDCIAIKSGKNPEGFYVAKPTRNVRITDCDFKRGHGISIGSEMSGGVSDVLVQDCKAGNLLHGMQIKGTKDRGGYVKNVTVTDCELQKITVFTELNYNNDGEAAPEVPVFENFLFKNINLAGASIKEPVINVNGFKTAAHHLRKLQFENILLPDNAKIKITDTDHALFRTVKTLSGGKPEFDITNCPGLIN